MCTVASYVMFTVRVWSFVFFFKQKTAYEMRISDWSSDVCSSDLFDLVLLSAHRAREISGGSELTIDRDRDKNPVVALREIAEQTVRPHDIQDALVGSLQKVVVDEIGRAHV